MSADYVKWKDLDEVLDRHADSVVKRLRPELDSIDKRLDSGSEKFEKLETEVQQIRIECIKRHARLRGPTPYLGDDDEEEDVEDDKDVKAISSNTKKVVAIITAILVGAGTIFLLVLSYLHYIPS